MLKLISQPRTFHLHGAVFEALACPSSGSAETAAWIVSIPPGMQGTPHALTREEIFIALEGSARVRAGGQECDFEAGSALVVPAGTEFVLGNVSGRPFRAVAILPVGGQAVLAGAAPFSPPWTL